jgi:hypothetical protein
MLDSGVSFQSPGGTFAYVVVGPCCRLYDREELPWPSCSLAWKGKQPSWKRIGKRLVADIAVKRFPSYAVIGSDRHGNFWTDVVTDYTYQLPSAQRRWWYAPTPPQGQPWPEYA